MNVRRSMSPLPSLAKCTQVLTGLRPELGRPRLEPFRMLEQGQDLLVPELPTLGLPAPAECRPTLRQARSLPPDERLAASGRRALPGWYPTPRGKRTCGFWRDRGLWSDVGHGKS